MLITLREEDLVELKSLGRPPQGVKDVLAATLILLGYHEREAAEWVKVQRVLGTPRGPGSLVTRCERRLVSQIPREAGTLAKKYLGNLSAEMVRNCSMAVFSIYAWAVNVIGQVVQPEGS